MPVGRWRLALGLIAGIGCPAAIAGHFQVSPVLLDIQAPAAAGGLTLLNDDPLPLAVQARVYRWTQKDGEDVLVPTQDVVASPPIANVNTGKEQLVRIVRVAKTAPAAEEAYRVLIDELPVQGPVAEQQGVKVLVRYSVPVFFSPAGKAAPAKPQWSASLQGDRLTLAVSNTGRHRVRIAELALDAAGEKLKPFGTGLLGYVLPGMTRRWTTAVDRKPLERAGESVEITASTESGEIRERVPLSTGH